MPAEPMMNPKYYHINFCAPWRELIFRLQSKVAVLEFKMAIIDTLKRPDVLDTIDWDSLRKDGGVFEFLDGEKLYFYHIAGNNDVPELVYDLKVLKEEIAVLPVKLQEEVKPKEEVKEEIKEEVVEAELDESGIDIVVPESTKSSFDKMKDFAMKGLKKGK